MHAIPFITASTTAQSNEGTESPADAINIRIIIEGAKQLAQEGVGALIQPTPTKLTERRVLDPNMPPPAAANTAYPVSTLENIGRHALSDILRTLSPLETASIAQVSRAMRAQTTAALEEGAECSITAVEQLGQGAFGERVQCLYVDIPLNGSILLVMSILFNRFPNLTHLDLGPVAKESLRTIHFLSLSNNLGVRDAGITAVVAHSPALKFLHLKGCPITDATLEVLKTQCPLLRALDVTDFPHLTAPGIAALRAARPTLRISENTASQIENTPDCP